VPTAEFPTAPDFERFPLNNSRTVHSLFKVHFIFPSRYLFAIGFLPLSPAGSTLGSWSILISYLFGPSVVPYIID